MTSSQPALTLAAAILAILVATSAIAEDMSLPGPSGDCLVRAQNQLSIDQANCTGRYPAYTQLYSQCIANAYVAYAGAINFCQNVSGAKLSALRGSEVRDGKTTTLARR